jgi:hypothetical protein
MADRVALAVWQYRPSDNAASRTVRLHHEGLVLWHGHDVAAALDIDPADMFDIPAHRLNNWETDDGDDVPFYDTDTVLALAAHSPRFLSFIQWVLGCLEAGSRRPILITPAPHSGRDVVDIIDVRADTFSVVRAAHLISRDPVLNVGRDALFDTIRELGWVTKHHDAFIPTATAEAAGMLARNRIWDPRTKVAYNQVRITRAGIHELHRVLGGVTAPDLDAPEPTHLVEV